MHSKRFFSAAPVALGNHSSLQSRLTRKATHAMLGLAVIAAAGTACLPTAHAAVSGSSKFIPTLLVYYGGGPALTSADAARLAKYDLLDMDRFRYQQINGSTWSSIKALNPNIEIYLYEMGPESQNYMDSTTQVSLNGLGRYNVSRNHPMGSLNGNNPNLYLTDASGNRIYSKNFSNVSANQYWNLMDFGSSAYQSYWVTSAKADIIDQPWRADGVFADNCLTFAASGGYSATASKYPNDTAWSSAMNSFASGIASGLHGYGQKLWCNKGDSRNSLGSSMWQQLDASADHPDILMDEGAFGVEWGAAVQFYPENEWKNQVDTIGALQNTKAGLMSHTQLSPGGSGTDNWGKPVTFWQAFYYAIGSLLVGKNAQNNSYLMFSSGTNYNSIVWFDEYDNIDLGRPVSNYTISNVGGVNVYWREFELGYVAVNPTANNVASFSFPQAVKPITHDNVLSQGSIAAVSSLAINGHNAAIVLKTSATSGGGGGGGVTTPDTTPPSVPANLTGSAVSSSQVNLSWSAAADNIGVTGYYVYLNNAILANVGNVTSFQHTGLTAGTTYNYRVSAYDAAGNNGAWTATPIAVTTPAAGPAPDTTSPSVPPTLSATPASPTQINLTWAASTDNVGVTGYYVYLNNAILAKLGNVLSYQHAGLTPGTTYNYRVSSFDAAGNNSAWTNAVAATTPVTVADTTPPSVPTGLTVTMVASTQVNLAWQPSSDNVGVTGYIVYLNDQVLANVGNVTSFQHNGLTPGVTYNYRVSAYDAVPNHSAWTGVVSATTSQIMTALDTTPPSVPAGFTATNITATSLTLTWQPSTDNVGVLGYYVYLNDVAVRVTPDTSITFFGLTPNTTYKYRVSSYDPSLNNSAWTAALSVRTKKK